MIRQGIETKYMGATNFRPERISAKAWAGSLIVSYDYELNGTENHINSAKKLADKYGWEYEKIYTGGNSKGTGYLHILD